MPTQQQPTLGTNQSQIDPTALNLSRAIRQVESGDNPNAKGASGEHGIGQWMPGNFESAASKYGLDPNDKSQSNQEHVLYNQVEEQLKAGHSQSQVASWWNSGKYDPTGNVGINKEGVKYDTPAYVEKVKQAYIQASQGQVPQGNGYVQPPPPVQPPNLSNGVDTSATNGEPQGQNIGQQILEGAKSIGKTIEQPFVSLAALPVQGLAKILGQKDPYANFANKTGLAPVTSTDQSLGNIAEQEAGNAAQVGSYFVPGSGVLGAAGMGALQGAGSAMSQGKDLGTTLVSGAEGAALGGGAGGLTKLAGSGISKLGGLLSGDTANEAIQGVKNAYGSALNLNAGERAFESRSGKDLAQVLMENEAPLARNANGTLDAEAAIEKLQSAMKPLNEQAKAVLSHPQGIVKDISLPDVLTQVQARIQDLPISQLEKNAALAHAKDVIGAEAKQYGNTVTPEIADQIKQGMWGTSFRGKLTTTDKLQSNVSYLTGNTLKTEIEKAVAGTDAGNVLPKINEQRSNLADAIKRLTNLDGQRLLKGGRLGNMTGGIIGSIAGAASGLGAPGALAGDYFGTKAAEFLNDPATKIAIAQGKAKASGLFPSLLGKSAIPVGRSISKVGNVVKGGTRSAGLLTNLLTNGK